MYSWGPPHMDVQKQDDQHELTYSNYVRTQDVTLKTCQRRWMIGRSGERGSGISVLAARHDEMMMISYLVKKWIYTFLHFFHHRNSLVNSHFWQNTPGVSDCMYVCMNVNMYVFVFLYVCECVLYVCVY